MAFKNNAKYAGPQILNPLFTCQLHPKSNLKRTNLEIQSRKQISRDKALFTKTSAWEAVKLLAYNIILCGVSSMKLILNNNALERTYAIKLRSSSYLAKTFRLRRSEGFVMCSSLTGDIKVLGCLKYSMIIVRRTFGSGFIEPLKFTDYDLQLPLPTTNFLKRSFSYRGAIAWNQLLNQKRGIDDLTSFKLAIS